MKVKVGRISHRRCESPWGRCTPGFGKRITYDRLTADQQASGHDFFSTHCDINHLPEKLSPHGGTLEASENRGRAHMTSKRGPRLWHSPLAIKAGVCFRQRERVERRTLFFRDLNGQIFVIERNREWVLKKSR